GHTRQNSSGLRMGGCRQAGERHLHGPGREPTVAGQPRNAPDTESPQTRNEGLRAQLTEADRRFSLLVVVDRDRRGLKVGIPGRIDVFKPIRVSVYQGEPGALDLNHDAMALPEVVEDVVQLEV